MFGMFSLKELFARKSLSLGSFFFIAVAFCLTVFGGAISNGVSLYLLQNVSFAASTMNSIVAFAPWVGFFIRIVGVCIFVFVAYTTRFKVETRNLKRQFTRLSSVVTFLLIAFIGISLVEVPLVRAENVSAIGGYLTTPFGVADWYIGNHTVGRYFAVNGSDWNDLTSVQPWQPSPIWLSYASNYTKLEEMALASITFGTVYLKEVPFNYNLTVPANVQVVENVNGLTRTFVSSGSSEGSPFTVSVDTRVAGYYLVADRMDRVINSWTSTNAGTLLNNTCSALTTLGGGTIYVAAGNYPVDCVNVTDNINLVGSGYATHIIQNAGITQNVLQSAATSGGTRSPPSSPRQNITISDMHITGSFLSPANHGIDLRNVVDCRVENIWVDYSGDGVKFTYATRCQMNNIISEYMLDSGAEIEQGCIDCQASNINTYSTNYGLQLQLCTGRITVNGLIANQYQNVGLQIDHCVGASVSNVQLSGNTSSVNLYAGINFANSQQNIVSVGFVTQSKYGIRTGATTSTDAVSFANKCSSLQIYNNSVAGVYFVGTNGYEVYANTLIDSRVYDNTLGLAFHEAVNNTVTNCNVYADGVARVQNYALNFSTGAEFNVIRYNDLRNFTIGVSTGTVGSNLVYGNLGYSFVHTTYLHGGKGNTAQAMSVNRTVFDYVEFDVPVTIDSINFNLTAAGGVGAFFDLVIYADAGQTPAGGADLWHSLGNAGTVLGAKTVTVGVVVNAGRYWFGLAGNDTAMNYLRGIGILNYPSSPLDGCYFVNPVMETMPATCPAISSNSISCWVANINYTPL
jgi:hypothetical protein